MAQALNDDALKVSEIFASIQGEGASAGEPAAFLRLAGCNLHCVWCDTKYTWDWQAFDYEKEVTRLSVAAVHERLCALSPRRLVITGGEPLLQQEGIAALLQLLGGWIVELETNGTLQPGAELLARVDQWNVSPKLAHAADPLERRIQWQVLKTFAGTRGAWLKVVVQQASDLEEVVQLVTNLDWPKDRILLMPEAQSAELLALRVPLIAELCRQRGYAASPRLHIARWNGRRGV